MTHPPMLLRSSPLLLREGGHHQRPGKAGSAVVAGMACSAAFRMLRAWRLHGLRMAHCAMDNGYARQCNTLYKQTLRCHISLLLPLVLP